MRKSKALVATVVHRSSREATSIWTQGHLAGLAGDILLGAHLLQVLPLQAGLLLEALPLPLGDRLGLLRGDVRILHIGGSQLRRGCGIRRFACWGASRVQACAFAGQAIIAAADCMLAIVQTACAEGDHSAPASGIMYDTEARSSMMHVCSHPPHPRCCTPSRRATPPRCLHPPRRSPPQSPRLESGRLPSCRLQLGGCLPRPAGRKRRRRRKAIWKGLQGLLRVWAALLPAVNGQPATGGSERITLSVGLQRAMPRLAAVLPASKVTGQTAVTSTPRRQLTSGQIPLNRLHAGFWHGALGQDRCCMARLGLRPCIGSVTAQITCAKKVYICIPASGAAAAAGAIGAVVLTPQRLGQCIPMLEQCCQPSKPAKPSLQPFALLVQPTIQPLCWTNAAMHECAASHTAINMLIPHNGR